MNIFWFTGLSGAGKSTVAEALVPLLNERKIKVLILDGDAIRDRRTQKLGFSYEDIKLNNSEIAKLCQEKRKEADVILVPVISPYRAIRTEIRQQLSPHFKLIFCNANLQSVVERDVKGLYAKAQKGEINNMIGFSSETPYEAPEDADLILQTGVSGEGVSTSVEKALAFILKTLQK
jgi:adenylyl-sulfate kinase